MTVVSQSKQELIAEYKIILRSAIDKRPSGIRQKIAQIIGTHKSFVSQITNPNDPTPIPYRHLEAISDICHLSPKEEQKFFAAYSIAHPNQSVSHQHLQRHFKTLHIQVPVLNNAERQQEFETFVRDLIRKMSYLFSENNK